MSEKHSIASKARWAGIPLKKRTEIMRARANEKWDKVDPKLRRAHAMKMVQARKLKQHASA